MAKLSTFVVGAGALYLLSKIASTPLASDEKTRALNSSFAADAYANIEGTYGADFTSKLKSAVEQYDTAGEVFEALNEPYDLLVVGNEGYIIGNVIDDASAKRDPGNAYLLSGLTQDEAWRQVVAAVKKHNPIISVNFQPVNVIERYAQLTGRTYADVLAEAEKAAGTKL